MHVPTEPLVAPLRVVMNAEHLEPFTAELSLRVVARPSA
jgi:hypothetical protein